MKEFINEFKSFAVKGNVLDLAVAVVIGGAFGKIVSSLVENIIMPFIGILLGGHNFTGLKLIMGETAVTYGVFIQSIIDFTIVAFVIFMVVKAFNHMKALTEAPKVETPKATPEDIQLLREIRDALRSRGA